MLKAKAKEAGGRITVGEDKAYDTADHVAHLRAINVTPHVTQNDCITARTLCRLLPEINFLFWRTRRAPRRL